MIQLGITRKIKEIDNNLYNKYKNASELLQRDISQFQRRHDLFTHKQKSTIAVNDFFLYQCNGLELERLDITVRYLAIKDIYEKKDIESAKGLRIYRKVFGSDGQDVDYLLNNLVELIKSYNSKSYDKESYVTCDKKMEIMDGGHRLALALYNNQKYISLKTTISNWRQQPFFERFANAGLERDEIELIIEESDKLVDKALRDCSISQVVVDKDEFIKWLVKEYRKVYGFDKREFNGKSYVTLNNGGFYQSFPMLGIRGERPTDVRINEYGLNEILSKDMDVLDIGCNIGFLDMEISSKVRSVTGIEYNEEAAQLSKRISKKLGILNAGFIGADFKKWGLSCHRKYDFIFSFAVHKWIGLKPDEYADMINNLLKENGCVIFESHSLSSHKNFDDYINAFEERNLVVQRRKPINDDGKTEREFVLLRKKKP